MADAPPVRAEAEVRLWGGTVGALVELESGRVRFEYADAFRGRDLGFGLFLLRRRDGSVGSREIIDGSAADGAFVGVAAESRVG